MEGIPKEAWIIIYIWDSPEDWVGGYPSNLWQQMKTQNGTTPEQFDTYEDAKKCAEVDGLYNYRIIPVAGEVVKEFYTSDESEEVCTHEYRRIGGMDRNTYRCKKCGIII